MRATTFLLSLTLLAAPAAASAQDNTAFAQQRFSQGTQLYEQHSWEPALAEFRQSIALYNSPNTRLYIARCLRELGRFDESVLEFERTAREAGDRAASDPRYATTRDVANSELTAVRPRVGRLTVTVPDLPTNAVVRVNGRDIPREGVGVAMPVMPGHVAVHVESPEFFPEDRETDVVAGGEATVGIPLRRRPVLEGHTEVARPLRTGPVVVAPPPRGGVPRSLGWIGVGVGAAGVIGFAAFGALASSTFSDLSAQCGGNLGPCSTEQLSRRDSGRTYTTLANVSLGVGIAGAVAATVLFLVGRPAQEPRPAPTVTVGLSGSGVSLGGVF
jgi:hypothetical protein